MRAVSTIERHYQAGRLPKNAASVIFKVPGKAAAQKLFIRKKKNCVLSVRTH